MLSDRLRFEREHPHGDCLPVPDGLLLVNSHTWTGHRWGPVPNEAQRIVHDIADGTSNAGRLHLARRRSVHCR